MYIYSTYIEDNTTYNHVLIIHVICLYFYIPCNYTIIIHIYMNI